MRAFVLLLFALLSGGEDLAALVAAAGKHVAAVAGLHALTETVNLFALPFLRLECTKHFKKVSTLIVATQSQSSRKGTNEMSKERKHFLPKQFSLNDLNILDCVAQF